MKKIVFLLTIFLITSFGYPEHYIMKVNLQNGTTDTIRVTDIKKIYFDLDPNQVNERNISNSAGSFILFQNYPNPFNPSTTIVFKLNKKQDAVLVIYNNIGQKVRTFEMSNLPVGIHQVEWNGKNETGEQVSSGLYYYTLITSGFSEVRKMLLIK